MVTIKGHEKLARLINACRQGADNTTPMSLVQEMIDKIPEEIWKDTSKTILDPAAGSGTFLVAAYWKMIQAGDTHENIIENRLFACEVNLVYLKVLRDKLGLKNIYDKDFLQFDDSMKFDVVIGNPPYQDSNGAASSKAIWHNFVDYSLYLLNKNGYLCMVHPNGWRAPSGKFTNIKNKLLSNNLKFLRLADFEEGKRVFNAGTSFDYYVLIKDQYRGSTTVIDTLGRKYIADLRKAVVISNHSQEILDSVTTDISSERIDYIYHTGYHTQRDYISKEKTSVFKYPVVYTITTANGIKFTYSSRKDLGHFGVPKLIWSNGMGTQLILDLKGEYAMNEFAFAIGGTEEYLMKVKEAMESDKFLDLMSSVRFTNNKYIGKVIKTFKKDFWREFL